MIAAGVLREAHEFFPWPGGWRPVLSLLPADHAAAARQIRAKEPVSAVLLLRGDLSPRVRPELVRELRKLAVRALPRFAA